MPIRRVVYQLVRGGKMKSWSWRRYKFMGAAADLSKDSRDEFGLVFFSLHGNLICFILGFILHYWGGVGLD